MLCGLAKTLHFLNQQEKYLSTWPATGCLVKVSGLQIYRFVF